MVLWFQFAYAIWQFVRVAKFCRLPYATLVHTFMWIIGRWGRPFTVRNYIVLDPARQRYFVNPDVLVGDLIKGWSENENKPGRKCILDIVVPDGDLEAAATGTLIPIDLRPLMYELHRLTLKDEGLDYQFCSRMLRDSFVWNYLRDDPDCFARSADLIVPTFEILDRVSHLDGLKKICQGDYIPVARKGRFLAVPDRERELNQNFMRMLASIPLMAQAKGFNDESVWISLAIIAIDQASLPFNWLWQRFKEYMFYLFHMFMIKSRFQPQTRKTICTFFSTIGDRMMFSDEVCLNFIRLKKGDIVYTMSPFNGADFEIVKNPFERKHRKKEEPSTAEMVGTYENANGEILKDFPAEGTHIITHEVRGSKIETMFIEGGGFYNFINKQHLHFGTWYIPTEVADEYYSCEEDFLDLLQVMEDMQMLPVHQTDGELLKSLKFNDFLKPGGTLQDITFLKVKRDLMTGGKP